LSALKYANGSLDEQGVACTCFLRTGLMVFPGDSCLALLLVMLAKIVVDVRAHQKERKNSA